MGFLQTLLQFFTNGYKVEPPEYFKAVDTTLETEEELRKLLEESNAKVKLLEEALYQLATETLDATDNVLDSLVASGYYLEGDFKDLKDFTDEEAAEYFSLS
jgi:hypothetical protein